MSEMESQNQADKEVIGLKSIIVDYLYHWKLFLFIFILSLIPAILYLVFYPRTYEMMARIQIQEDKEVSGGSFGLGEAAGFMKTMGLSSMSLGPINIEDEITYITSHSLLQKMIIELGINVEYSKPFSFYRLYSDCPYILSTDSLTDSKLFEAIDFEVRIKNEKIIVTTKTKKRGKGKFEFNSLPGTIEMAEGTFLLNYSLGQEDRKDNINISYIPSSWVAENITDILSVEEVSKTSTVVELFYSDHEKERGVDILNTLISFYNDDAADYKNKEADKMMTFLDRRIDSVIYSLKSIEADIAGYKNANRIMDLEHDVLFYVEQMKELQVRIIEIEAQAHVINLMDDFIRDPANKYNLVPVLLSQDGEKGSALMSYNEILLERQRVIQNSDISNPLVKSLTDQADQQRKSVFASIENARKSVELTLNDIKIKEKALFDKMGKLPEQEKEFIDLRRNQEILQGVYLILLQKREETALNGGIDKVKARVLDNAFVKSKPIGPRKLYAAIGILLLTLAIPVMYLFARKHLVDLIREYRIRLSKE